MNLFYKGFARVFQKCMCVAMNMMPWPEAKETQGEGTILKMADILKENGLNNVLIVTDKFVKENLLPETLKKLNEKGVKYSLYDEVVPNPTLDNINAAFKIYKDNKCNGIVAVGGGSVMDCAKIVGALAKHPNRKPESFRGLLKCINRIPTFMCVPTTAGTGSEKTVAAVISNPKTFEKFPCNDLAFLPHFIIFDPKLTVSLTPELTATTGMDALTHAVEAYIGHSNTKLTKASAEKAVKLIFDNVYTAYSEPTNIKARENMQEAAKLAGIAFTRAYVGYVHAIGHACGAVLGMAHGLAMSVILPNMLDEYGSSDYKALAKLADIVGIKGNSIEEKAKAFIKAIRDLNAKMNIPSKIGGKYAMSDEQVKMIAYRANKEANPLYPCPVLFNEKELIGIVDRLREK